MKHPFVRGTVSTIPWAGAQNITENFMMQSNCRHLWSSDAEADATEDLRLLDCTDDPKIVNVVTPVIIDPAREQQMAERRQECDLDDAIDERDGSPGSGVSEEVSVAPALISAMAFFAVAGLDMWRDRVGREAIQ